MWESPPMHMAVIAAGIMLLVLLAVLWRARASARQMREPSSEEIVSFLFDGGVLIDASTAARNLLSSTQGSEGAIPMGDWQRVRNLFQSRFPDLPEQAESACNAVLAALKSGDNARLQLDAWDSFQRLTLLDNRAGHTGSVERHKLEIFESELHFLRQVVNSAPNPAWLCTADQKVVWANTAYRDLCQRLKPDCADSCGSCQGQRCLFDIDLPRMAPNQKARTSLSAIEGERIHWFDVSAQQIGDTWMLHAADVNAVVNAEIAQRNFVQTLAKTFAQLSTGLAIFDRNRQLALFNPALIDLTQLSPEFLSARPNLLSFFDQLRERHMMPEPKNYISWRDQISELIYAAAHGGYSETWNLTGGVTFRVTGRPHPDGAVAFLIEDISVEMSHTRQSRAEIERYQAMLDEVGEAIALIGEDGMLTMSNQAFHRLWSLDPDSSFARVTLSDALSIWQQPVPDAPIWEDLRRFVHGSFDRDNLRGRCADMSGRPLELHAVRVGGHMTMVRFTPAQTTPFTPSTPPALTAAQ